MKIIYAHLPKREKQAFSDYAEELGFKASEVAKFLVLRELRLGGLKQVSKMSEERDRRSPNEDKITVHLPSAQVKGYFKEQAKEAGLSESHALAALIRIELYERKLEVALNN